MNKRESQNKKLTYEKKGNRNLVVSENKLYMLPLIIIIGIIPFIIRYHEYNTGLSTYNWFSTEETNFDFFLYFKQQFFLIICSIMLILVVYRIYRNKNHSLYSPVFIPLGIYAILSFLSTIFSKYSSFGYKGIFEQFESVFVLLGYCLTVYYAFLFIKTEADIEVTMRFFLYSVIALGVIGVLQAIGFDIFSSSFGFRMILPRNLWTQAENFELKFGKNTTYLSMYNPNYVGVYTAMTAPVFACIALTVNDHKIKILNIVAVILLLISLYGSKSNAGVIGILVAALLILIFMRKYIFCKPKIAVPVLVIGIASLLIVSCVKWKSISNIFMALIQPVKTEEALNEISTTPKYIEIIYMGNKLRVAFSDDSEGNLSVDIRDENDQELPIVTNTATTMMDIQDERFQNIHFKPVFYNNTLFTDIQIDGKDWMFTHNLEDGNYYYMNRFGRLDKITTAESAVFTDYESFASGRGYLWSRTIPLLKDHMLLGSGADTFVLEFPQNDYVNLYKYGFENEIVTKPHSLYLQIGVQTGVLSLISFLVFYAMYFVSSVCLYIKGQFENVFSQTGVAIFIGTVTFMITGITNDSCITVTPVFWALIGIGIAVNIKVNTVRKQARI